MRKLFALALAIVALGGGAWWLTAGSESPTANSAPASAPADSAAPAFDAVAVASAETAMWKAYYAGKPDIVLNEMTRLLEVQAGLAATDARAAATSMATAAAKFQMVRGGYDRFVLPDLVAGYECLKTATGRDFDAEDAARAELEWWVRRRTPGKDDAESVGDAIADLYAELYGTRNDAIKRAGLLRAEAAKLRDSGGDWARVEELLVQSHQSLLAGIAAAE